MAALNKEEQLRLFENLRAFMEDAGLSGEILPESRELPLLTLIVGIRDGKEDGFWVSVNHMPIPDEDKRFTNYFHLYTEIPLDVSAMDRLTVLEIVNTMNRYTSVGHFICTVKDNITSIQMRYTISVDVDESFTGSLLYENVEFMFYYCSLLQSVLINAAAGMTLEEAFKEEGMEY